MAGTVAFTSAKSSFERLSKRDFINMKSVLKLPIDDLLRLQILICRQAFRGLGTFCGTRCCYQHREPSLITLQQSTYVVSTTVVAAGHKRFRFTIYRSVESPCALKLFISICALIIQKERQYIMFEGWSAVVFLFLFRACPFSCGSPTFIDD